MSDNFCGFHLQSISVWYGFFDNSLSQRLIAEQNALIGNRQIIFVRSLTGPTDCRVDTTLNGALLDL
jgi:hypothetical protein